MTIIKAPTKKLTEQELDSIYKGKITATPSAMTGPGVFKGIRNRQFSATDVPWFNQESAELANSMLELRTSEDLFDTNDQNDIAEYQQRIINAYYDDQAAAELASYRVFDINADILAVPFAMSAFLGVNLNPDEQVVIRRPRSFNLNSFTVRSVSLSGDSKRDQWQSTDSHSTYDMEALTTDRIEYPLNDLQTGNISQIEAINDRLQYDMEHKMDTLALSNINAAQVTVNLRDMLSFDPKVEVANIPDYNYIDLHALFPGNENVLTLPKLKHILHHIDMFQYVEWDGTLQPAAIFMSPLNTRDAWDFIDLVSGWDSTGNADVGPESPRDTVPTAVRDAIFQNGMFTQAYGKNLNWVPNTQIEKGRMYITMTQPLGWHFTKSAFDEIFTWGANSPEHVVRNMGETLMRKTSTFVVPDLWRYRILIIDL